MYRSVGGVVAWLIVAGALLSAEPGKQDPAGKLVRDLWDAAYLDSARAGYIRTTVRETEKDGTKYFHTTVTLELTLRRFQDVIRQQMESGTVETADGKVTAVSMRQSLGKEQQMALTGTV